MTIDDLNVLVVEDDYFQRQMFVNMLLSLGVRSTFGVGNGQQAIEIIRRESGKPVDIVICDLNMPGMDGLEFLRHVGEEHHNISIVLISGLGSKLLSTAGKMTKMYGTRLLGAIEKPILMGQLKGLLLKYERSESMWQPAPVATARFSLEEILLGIRAKQFEPFFQPKVEMKTGRLVGAEALARWIHPQQGICSPCDFIQLLEQSGNIDDLTFLILERSAAACHLLHQRGYPLNISVNLSLASLKDVMLAEKITSLVRKSGLDPNYIVLEITESAVMTNVPHALENLARLCMSGFSLSIDDYGTGYSSLQQLTRIAFSELKIDRSFVKDFADSEMLCIVVESSIDMAHKLKVKSVAEGVETQQDWDALESMGCDTAQGYFIAEPMDLASFVEFCTGHASA